MTLTTENGQEVTVSVLPAQDNHTPRLTFEAWQETKSNGALEQTDVEVINESDPLIIGYSEMLFPDNTNASLTYNVDVTDETASVFFTVVDQTRFRSFVELEAVILSIEFLGEGQ